MYDVTKLPNRIGIGFKGEKRFRKIEIDMTKWDIPDGVPAIVYLKPEGTVPYRPTVTYTDHILTWVVDADDVNVMGEGFMQVEMKSADIAAKSQVVSVTINNALTR